MTFYYLKWRDDADGFVKAFAGNVMRHPFDTRAEAEELRRAMLNGNQVEIVTDTDRAALADLYSGGAR